MKLGNIAVTINLQGMKKIISLMLFITSIVCFTACSNEEELPNIPTSRYMKVGESFNLGYASNWVSSNTFAATVDNEGVVSAVRKGEANIYSTDKDLSCYISVSPSYTLYNDPISQWGISKNSVISKKGTPNSETSTLLTYNTSSTITPIEMYLFENNSLKASAIVVKTSYTDELVEHLSQRFKPAAVDVENYSLYFIDGETLSTTETYVLAQLYNTSYWLVMYSQNTSTRSAVNQNELFEIVKSEIESIGIIKE